MNNEDTKTISVRYISSSDYNEFKRLEKNKGLIHRLIGLFIKNQAIALLLEFLILIGFTAIITALAGGWLVSPLFPITTQGVCIGLIVLTLFL